MYSVSLIPPLKWTDGLRGYVFHDSNSVSQVDEWTGWVMWVPIMQVCRSVGMLVCLYVGMFV